MNSISPQNYAHKTANGSVSKCSKCLRVRECAVHTFNLNPIDLTVMLRFVHARRSNEHETHTHKQAAWKNECLKFAMQAESRLACWRQIRFNIQRTCSHVDGFTLQCFCDFYGLFANRIVPAGVAKINALDRMVIQCALFVIILVIDLNLR